MVRKKKTNSMKQPIFLVDRKDVVGVIEHQSHFCIIPYGLEWGKVQTKDELISAINSLPERIENKLDMNKVSQCIKSFYTSKMPGNANRMLERIWEIIKTKRISV